MDLQLDHIEFSELAERLLLNKTKESHPRPQRYFRDDQTLSAKISSEGDGRVLVSLSLHLPDEDLTVSHIGPTLHDVVKQAMDDLFRQFDSKEGVRSPNH